MIITAVNALRVWDSRGRPTVEVNVTTKGGTSGRAIAPAGASTGVGEALDLRDGGQALGGYDVRQAVQNVEGAIASALIGMDVRDQSAIDLKMHALDGTENCTRLGGNAMIATSMAVAHAAARAADMPLWAYLQGDDTAQVYMPVPEIQIFGGGAHANGQMDLQDFMVVPFGAPSFSESLEWVSEIYLAAGAIFDEKGLRFGVADEGGYWPVFSSNEESIEMLLRAIELAGFSPEKEVGLSLDIAASQFYKDGKYVLAKDGETLDTQAWHARLRGWLEAYPIKMIEDPFAEDDFESHADLCSEFGHRMQIIGDDLLVTNAKNVHKAAEMGAVNTLLCKPNQAGTLTRTREAVDAARKYDWDVVVSARSGESEDITIVHLVTGWGLRQLKVGSFTRSERMAKWNEVLRLERALGDKAVYAGSSAFGRFMKG